VATEPAATEPAAGEPAPQPTGSAVPGGGTIDTPASPHETLPAAPTSSDPR
jgi:hypothetical protein